VSKKQGKRWQRFETVAQSEESRLTSASYALQHS